MYVCMYVCMYVDFYNLKLLMMNKASCDQVIRIVQSNTSFIVKITYI